MPDWNQTRAFEALGIVEELFTMPDGNCQGYARQRTIAVSPVAELPHKTRFHELAHVVLGHTAEAEAGLSDSDITPRSLREVEAEAVALVCLEALGLPAAEHCRGYIQHWNEHRGAEPIPERSAQRIFKAADQILKAGTSEPVAGGASMSPRDFFVLRRVLDDVANAVQGAIGLASHLRRQTQNIADDAIVLEAAIGRAIAALKRLQARRRGGHLGVSRSTLKRWRRQVQQSLSA
jgi:hypothetical protein